MKKSFALVAFLAASALAACGGGGGSSIPGGTPTSTPGATATPVATPTPTPAPTATPGLAVGVALPTTSIGSLVDPTYGEVGGYSQSTYSQTLAFPVGSTITVTNLGDPNSGPPHTFNVVSTTGFPANPTLSTNSSGSGVISATYASGELDPGSSVQIALSTGGTYYFGCAYHYLSSPQMRDVIQVSNAATPGPQATPAPTPTGGDPCQGYYC